MRTIYAFAVKGLDYVAPDVLALAVNDKGEDIAFHISSSMDWAKYDIGMTSNRKHGEYDKLFPEGWQMVWVDDPESNQNTRLSCQKALQMEREIP
jgi:hypothetical protein